MDSSKFSSFHERREKYEMSGKEILKVYVSELDKSIGDEDLKDYFSQCGIVQSAKVQRFDDGSSLGTGYVSFTKPQYGERAVNTLNNTKMKGCTIRVTPFVSRMRTVFVKGFGKSLTNKDLKLYFKRIGDVETSAIDTFDNGGSKGRGYVTFYNSSDAAKAIADLNGTQLFGKISVEYYKCKEKVKEVQERNLYVKGFGTLFDDEDLTDLFKKFGEIESAKVATDENGSSKGYGFVCFKDRKDALLAMLSLNEYKVDSIVLSVCVHKTKEDRRMEMKNKNLHIKSLDISTTDEDLKELFMPYGTISSAHVDPTSSRGLKQGYVNFVTVKEADDAISALDGSEYKGRVLQVAVHRTKDEMAKSRASRDFQHHTNFHPIMKKATLNNYLDREIFNHQVSQVSQPWHELRQPRLREAKHDQRSSKVSLFDNVVGGVKNCSSPRYSYGNRSKSMGNISRGPLLQQRIAANFDLKLDRKDESTVSKEESSVSKHRSTAIKGNAKLKKNAQPKPANQYESVPDLMKDARMEIGLMQYVAKPPQKKNNF